MPESHALEESGKNLKTHLVQTLILHIRWKLQSAVMMVIKVRVFLELGKRCQVMIGTSRCQLGFSVSISKSFLSGRNLIVLCLHGHFREVYSSGIRILRALLLSHSLL